MQFSCSLACLLTALVAAVVSRSFWIFGSTCALTICTDPLWLSPSPCVCLCVRSSFLSAPSTRASRMKMKLRWEWASARESLKNCSNSPSSIYMPFRQDHRLLLLTIIIRFMITYCIPYECFMKRSHIAHHSLSVAFTWLQMCDDDAQGSQPSFLCALLSCISRMIYKMHVFLLPIGCIKEKHHIATHSIFCSFFSFACFVSYFARLHTPVFVIWVMHIQNLVVSS